MPTWDLFLAHASVDKARIRPLVAAARALDLRVFLDEDCIPPGEEWDLFIPRAQRDSAVTVACVSASYVQAFYERSEVHEGIRLKRRGGHAVVPVHLDGPPGPDDVLYGLNLLQGLVLPALGVQEVARRLAEVARGVGEPVRSAPAVAAPIEAVPAGVLHAALCRLTGPSFDELVFSSGLPRASLLPGTVTQSQRAINLIEHAGEREGGVEALVGVLRWMRPGIV
jgi:hypothetical protein